MTFKHLTRQAYKIALPIYLALCGLTLCAVILYVPTANAQTPTPTPAPTPTEEPCVIGCPEITYNTYYSIPQQTITPWVISNTILGSANIDRLDSGTDYGGAAYPPPGIQGTATDFNGQWSLRSGHAEGTGYPADPYAYIHGENAKFIPHETIVIPEGQLLTLESMGCNSIANRYPALNLTLVGGWQNWSFYLEDGFCRGAYITIEGPSVLVFATMGMNLSYPPIGTSANASISLWPKGSQPECGGNYSEFNNIPSEEVAGHTQYLYYSELTSNTQEIDLLTITGTFKFLGAADSIEPAWYHYDAGSEAWDVHGNIYPGYSSELAGTYIISATTLKNARFEVCSFNGLSAWTTSLVTQTAPFTPTVTPTTTVILPTVLLTDTIEWTETDGPCITLGPIDITTPFSLTWEGLQVCTRLYTVDRVTIAKVPGVFPQGIDVTVFVITSLNAVGVLLTIQMVRKR